jgi:hydrogenase maturation protease
MKIAVIGIGQSLRGDDGAGPEAVRRWSTDFPPSALNGLSVRIEVLDTPGLELIDHLQGCDAALLVDAVSTGKPPGTVSVFSAVPDTSLTAAEKTAHGFGVAETLALARRAGERLPGRILLIGIEGEQYELGKGLSASVERAIANAAGAIQGAISEWSSGTAAE